MFSSISWDAVFSYLFFSIIGEGGFPAFFLFFCFPICLTVLHEFGHYYAARLFGIQSIEFSLGKGPVLFKSLFPSGCVFVLRLFPFGGRVVYGRAFERAPFLNRAVMSAAGGFLEIVLAALFAFLSLMFHFTHPFVILLISYAFLHGCLFFTPLTGDRRKIIYYVFLYLKILIKS